MNNAANKNSPQKIVADFIAAFSRVNEEEFKNFLADNLVSFITNSQSGVNKLESRAEFMLAIPKDVASIKPSVNITQILPVKDNQVLVMVEVKAERKGKKLHNHAAYLMTVTAGKITEIWMVEALPAYSDDFWKS